MCISMEDTNQLTWQKKFVSERIKPLHNLLLIGILYMSQVNSTVCGLNRVLSYVTITRLSNRKSLVSIENILAAKNIPAKYFQNIPYLQTSHLSRLMGKPTICIGENKDADQLHGNREADQRLCFRYSDSTIPPLLNSKISSF